MLCSRFVDRGAESSREEAEEEAGSNGKEGADASGGDASAGPSECSVPTIGDGDGS